MLWAAALPQEMKSNWFITNIDNISQQKKSPNTWQDAHKEIQLKQPKKFTIHITIILPKALILDYNTNADTSFSSISNKEAEDYPFIGAHAYTRTKSLISKCYREIKNQFLVKMNTIFKLYTKFYILQWFPWGPNSK